MSTAKRVSRGERAARCQRRATHVRKTLVSRQPATRFPVTGKLDDHRGMRRCGARGRRHARWPEGVRPRAFRRLGCGSLQQTASMVVARAEPHRLAQVLTAIAVGCGGACPAHCRRLRRDWGAHAAGPMK